MEDNLLGVKINYPFVKKNFNEILNTLINKKDSSFIFTVNPEFVVDSTTDSYFKAILNKGSFNSADGIGVVMALEYQHLLKSGLSPYYSIILVLKKLVKGSLTVKRFTGVEITQKILEYADQNYLSIFLLGGDKSKLVSEKLLIALEQKYRNINFIGASSLFSSKPNDDEVTIDYIKECMSSKGVKVLDFILVGYGHPYQEKWIDRNFSKLKIRVFVGVGGTFDFLSGNIRRAPTVIQKIGLEWLFRLIQQPKRFKRIFKAVVIFSYLIFNKIKQNSNK